MVVSRETSGTISTIASHLGFGIVLLLLSVFTCASINQQAVEGVFDLSQWQPSDGPIRLDGQWGVAWKVQLSPTEWSQPNGPWFNMPGTWDLPEVLPEPQAGRGYATFTAVLKDLPAVTDWALYIPEQSTSFRLFINNEVVAEGGIAGISQNSTLPYSGNQLIDLGKLENEVKLTWHVSNFHHNSGGPWQSMVIGPRAEISRAYVVDTFDQGIVVALSFIASLFLFLQYVVDRKDKSPLILSAFALLIAVCVGLSANQPLYFLIGPLYWPIHIRLLYWTMMLAMPLIMYWQHYTFPKEVNIKVARYTAYIFSVPLILILILPTWMFTALLMPFQYMLLAAMPVFLWSLYRVIVARCDGAYFIAAGTLLLAVCAVHDIALYSQWISDDNTWTAYGMLGFMLTLALNTLYSRARQKQQVENLRDQLMVANRQLEVRVAQRTIELAEKADALEEANEKLQVLANIDGLTGVLNRRAFVEQMEMLARLKPKVAIVMIDVDHFKQVNDTYGHAVGDQVLQRLSDLLLSMKRESDRVGRFGGEEFVFLLQGLSESGLKSFCRRLIDEVRTMALDDIDGPEKITVSVGASTGELLKKDIDDLLKYADHAMYSVKRSGRDDFRLHKMI